MPPRKRAIVKLDENAYQSLNIKQVKIEKPTPFKPIDLNINKSSSFLKESKFDINNNQLNIIDDDDLPDIDLKQDIIETKIELIDEEPKKRKQSDVYSTEPNEDIICPKKLKSKSCKLKFSSDEENDDKENSNEKEKETNCKDSELVTPPGSDDQTTISKRKRRIRYKKSDESDVETQDEPRYKLRCRKQDQLPSKYEPDSLLAHETKSYDNVQLSEDDELSEETIAALNRETERLKRLEAKRQQFNQDFKLSEAEQFYLDTDSATDKKQLKVHDSLVSKMKPHQLEGVKFMYDCCFESLKQIENNMKGDGCILAHCMGLGKSLQVVSLVHTLLANSELTKCERVLILLPVNVMLNWQNEFEKWTENCSFKVPVYEISSSIQTKDKNKIRFEILRKWYESGGVVLMGYQMFSNLIHGKYLKTKNQTEKFKELLCKPGPDLVICDEGHVLKNEKVNLSKAVNQIQTRRRIVLTGTPLQNNLIEYYCMVSFVKHNLLGSLTDFNYRFVRPIYEGQSKDSSEFDVRRMKMRAHVLHETLKGCVNRKDFSVIKSFLPPKNEYVLSIRLSDLQVELYKLYLAKIRRIEDASASNLGKIKSAILFADFHTLSKIWTHPWLLKEREYRYKLKAERAKDKDFINDDDEDDEDDEDAPTKRRKYKKKSTVDDLEAMAEADDNQWYADLVTPDCEFDIGLSGKFVLFEQILDMCTKIGDKLIVFSQSLMSLDMIERFLALCTRRGKSIWNEKQDYYRIDGSVDIAIRKQYLDPFNDPSNTRARLFLISTKAGGVGINLVAANRCIIFDSTWNPCYDTQSIFRIYRLGQDREVFVYRFLAQGTMEEKIYMRQVTKNALSQRVIDEHTLDRHYTKDELRELYCFNPDIYDGISECYELPKDHLLRALLLKNKRWILKFHEHDSLLENKIDEGLTDDDRKAAWALYEAETKAASKDDINTNQIESNNQENNCVIS